MRHVIVQNAGELPLWGMRLLGLSTKNSSQIGQFGTGLKEAIALLIRLDCSPIIFSGTCKIEFGVLDDGEQDEIHFKLSEQRGKFAPGEWYGLGIHPEFGKADWNNEWMALRELICNALDESGLDNLYHDIVNDPPSGVAGSTRIYIPAPSNIIQAYAETESRILVLSDDVQQVASETLGYILKKRKNTMLQIFHKGIWVQEATQPSLYDYDLPYIRLTESRSSDWYNVRNAMASLMKSWSKGMAEELILGLLKERRNFYEKDILLEASYSADVENGKVWVEAFTDIFGSDAVLCINDRTVYDKTSEKGKKPIICDHGPLYTFLAACGVPTASSLMTDKDYTTTSIADPPDHLQRNFDALWARIEEANLTIGKPKPALKIFAVENPVQNAVKFGYYDKGVCYINQDFTHGAQAIKTCVEEICHYVSDAGDRTHSFQGFLVTSLAVVLCKLPGKAIVQEV